MILSKKNSKILYGIAIIMMVYHHLFAIPERLNCTYISILGVFNLEMKIAYFCKICVAIYAFISGYGVYKSLGDKNKESIKDKAINDYKYVLKHIFEFYKKYWLVAVIFITIGIIFFDKKIDMKSFLCIMSGYNTNSFNVEWWYVFQYLKMMLLFPIIDITLNIDLKKLSKKIIFCGTIICSITIAIGIIFKIDLIKIVKVIYTFIGGYTAVFLVGIIIAKYDIFEKIYKLTEKKNIPLQVAIILLLITIIGRIILANKASWAKLDFVFAPIFIYSVCIVFNKIELSNIIKILSIFAKYSTYIWFTHTFICYYYWNGILKYLKISAIIFMVTLLLSLLISIVLDKLYNFILIRGKNEH